MAEVIEARAVVRRLEPGAVWIEIEQEGCGRCQEPGGCGGQKLTQAMCAGPKVFRIEHSGSLLVGDSVKVAVPVREIRRGATLAYVLPLLLLLLGALLGMALAQDAGAILGGGAGLGLAWWNLRRWRSALEQSAVRPYLLP